MGTKITQKHTLLHETWDLDFCCYLQHLVAMEPPKSSQKVVQNRIKKSTTFPTTKSHPKSSQWLPKGLQIELLLELCF